MATNPSGEVSRTEASSLPADIISQFPKHVNHRKNPAAALDTPPPLLYNGIGRKYPRHSLTYGKSSRVAATTREHFSSASSEVNRQRETCDGNQSHEQVKVRHARSPPALCFRRERFRANRPTIIQPTHHSINGDPSQYDPPKCVCHDSKFIFSSYKNLN